MLLFSEDDFRCRGYFNNIKGSGFLLFVIAQKEIVEEKARIPLTWQDTCKMKYT